MFNSKLIFTLFVFTFFLTITSIIKNQSRILEKQILGLSSNILSKEKNLSEAELEFYYLSSPNGIEKKIKKKELRKFEPIKHSKIFNNVDDLIIFEKKLSNLINKNEKKIKKK